jgi:superfamily II DNA/RNA helicase
LAHKKFTTPTPIQDQAIPELLLGKDMIGLANTGTGKTGAFLLPTIEKIHKNPKSKCLILAPTRELATQIDAEFRQFAFGMKMFSTVCVGGMPIGRQIRSLGMLNHLVIGTPGRIKDLIERGVLMLDQYDTIVLDECDRMLDMGFIDDIKTILKQLPEKRQSLFFSATMPPAIRTLMAQFSRSPITVDIKTGTTTKNIAQDVVRVAPGEDKFAKLENLLKEPGMDKVIIFAETKRSVDQLSRELKSKGFRVGCLHGDKRQRERDRTLADFKGHSTNILIATDVAARGIDVKDVSHVINYTVPQSYEDYTHRIGRTGRAGKIGKALTFVH